MASCIIPRITTVHNRTKLGAVAISVYSNYNRIYQTRIEQGAIWEVEANKFTSAFGGYKLIVAHLVGSENFMATFEDHCFQTYSDLFFDVGRKGRLKLHGIKRQSMFLPLFNFISQLWCVPHNYLETQEERKEESVRLGWAKVVGQKPQDTPQEEENTQQHSRSSSPQQAQDTQQQSCRRRGIHIAIYIDE